jgi:hypothetical protein
MLDSLLGDVEGVRLGAELSIPVELEDIRELFL